MIIKYTSSGEYEWSLFTEDVVEVTEIAGKGYAMGTILYIPYFANCPNGGWFIVQDRGGAISNNKLDVYMNSYSECTAFGRRNLECYIYEF